MKPKASQNKLQRLRKELSGRHRSSGQTEGSLRTNSVLSLLSLLAFILPLLDLLVTLVLLVVLNALPVPQLHLEIAHFGWLRFELAVPLQELCEQTRSVSQLLSMDSDTYVWLARGLIRHGG